MQTIETPVVSEASIFYWLVLVVFIAAAACFMALLFVSAPYGRHARPGWGPTISSRAGWVLMESPAVVLFAVVYAVGDLRAEPVSLALLAMWMLHYIHRTFIYPFRLATASRRMPVSVVAMGFTFNLVNAYLNARWISHFGPYDGGGGGGPWLWIGTAIFGFGWWLNGWADRRLIRLRRPDDTAYRIPSGGAFEWVTCPNYLGEIIEWAGFALASRSPAALAFAVFTIANLVPRALAHHRWYKAEFPDYPPDRRAVIPFVL